MVGPLVEELGADLVQADLGSAGIVGAGVDVEHVRHAPDERGALLGQDAPALRAPGLERVCCEAWRPVSCATAATTYSATSVSARRRSDQRSRPGGGPINLNDVLRSLHAIIRKAYAPKDGATVLAEDASPRFTIHDLRHTHATHLLMDGWPVAVVSPRPGYANPEITLQLYPHAIADVQGEEADTPAAFAHTGTDSPR